MFHAPCKNCSDRYAGCHAKCKKYAEYAEKVKKIREKRCEKYHIDDEIIQVLKRR